MATIVLNSQTVTYNKIYYISPTGNDTTGDGTLAKPFATYDKAFTKVVAGDLIYFLKGNYNITKISSPGGYGSSFLYDNNIQLTIYAEPYTYITMNNPTNTMRDTHAICIGNANTKVIGFTIDYNINDGTRTSYMRALFGANDAGAIAGYVYNCFFILRSPTSFSYANGGNTLKCINCSFNIKATSMEAGYSGSTSFDYCVFNSTLVTAGTGYTSMGHNIISASISYDSMYSIVPSNTGYGVKYGLYRWKTILFLIEDAGQAKTTNGTIITYTDNLPYTDTKFTQYGMADLSKINSTSISILSGGRFKIALYTRK